MAKKRKVLPLKVPARASLYYLLASAVAKVIGVISTPLFTRLMSGESYGEYTLYISRLAFLSVTLSAVSTGVQGYREMSKAKDKQDDYVSSLLGISLTLCGIICILLFTFKGILALNYSTITILTLQLLCDSILYVGNMKAKYLYAYKQVFITSLFQSLISVILSFALINGAGLGYEARVWGLLIASIIVSIPILSGILSKCTSLYSKDMWRTVIKRLIPVFPYTLSGALSLQIDRFIISASLGRVALAKYSVAHSLAAALTMLTGAASSALGPWIMRKLNSNEEGTVAVISHDCSVLLAASIILVITAAPEAMSVLAPKSYSDATVAVLPIALSALPTFLYSLGCTVLIHRDFGAKVSLCAFFTSLTAILSGFLLIPKFGYFGAGVAHLISQTVGAIGVMALLCKFNEKIFSASKISIIFAVTLTLTLLTHASRGMPYVRIFILLCSLSALSLKLLRMRSLISEK